jgi:hypothetical protein
MSEGSAFQILPSEVFDVLSSGPIETDDLVTDPLLASPGCC